MAMHVFGDGESDDDRFHSRRVIPLFLVKLSVRLKDVSEEEHFRIALFQHWCSHDKITTSTNIFSDSNLRVQSPV